MKLSSRRGMTLIELLIAMIVASIVGAATLSLMMTQLRFAERTEADRSGLRVGRSALNALITDMRMVDPMWGIEDATPTSVTLRVPYALGLMCQSTETKQTILLLPVDSVAFYQPGYSGYATRGGTGVYTWNDGGTVAEVATSNTCTGSPSNAYGITAPASAPNQKTRQIEITTTEVVPVAVGTPVMLFRRTRFFFAPSELAGLEGRTALWREWLDVDGSAVELAAPFGDDAAFRFFERDSTDATDDPPADLTTLIGLELYLPGQSEHTPRMRNAPVQSDLRTQVFFVNRNE
jgi:prepilin-type N-terminal cleavage/methylation domain-containing protein